jgi:Zn-finger in ubiquitin-hydrolases and other protein
MTACTHMDYVRIRQLPEAVAGCEDCLASGGKWVHLRICLTCGHVGCCDSSPGRHASAHGHADGHPLIRSLQPGEDWSWCFVDQVGLEIPQVRGSTRIPPSPLAAGQA